MRRMIPWVGVVACCAVVGCGPMSGPMPQRVPDDIQKEFDDSWDKNLTPVGRHDRQEWLDLIVVCRAFQVGVDELHLTSVKKWKGGTVEMKIDIDRAKPESDHFTITVRDQGGKQLRSETYTREEVEKTANLYEQSERNDAQVTEAQKADWEARLKRVRGMVPERFRQGEATEK